MSPATVMGGVAAALIAIAALAAVAEWTGAWIYGWAITSTVGTLGVLLLGWAFGHSAGRDYENPFRDG